MMCGVCGEGRAPLEGALGASGCRVRACVCVDEPPGSKAAWEVVQKCSRAVMAVGCYHGMSDGR